MDEDADERRAHAGVVVTALGGAEDPAVRQVNARAEAIRLERELGIDAVGPRQIGVGRRASDEARERVEGEATGDLAGVVSAHAVGDGKQAKLALNEPAVFVDRADGSCVGFGVCLDHSGGPAGAGPAEWA